MNAETQWPKHRPPEGYVCPVHIERVVDGDTFYVRPTTLTFAVPIRPLDCWAPDRGEPGYDDATACAEKIIARYARMAHIQIPRPDAIFAWLSFGRPLAWVWLDETTTFNELMVASGFAFRTKRELEDWITEQEHG